MGMKESMEQLKSKIDELLDQTDVDDKIRAGAADLKAKLDEALEKTDIDEKIAAGAQGEVLIQHEFVLQKRKIVGVSLRGAVDFDPFDIA